LCDLSIIIQRNHISDEALADFVKSAYLFKPVYFCIDNEAIKEYFIISIWY
jgi:hypothetical protein